MKFVSYLKDGDPTFGGVVEGRVYDLGLNADAPWAGVKEMLADSSGLKNASALISRWVGEAKSADCSLDEVTFLPVVPDPGKIICVGLNYENHRAETKRAKVDHPTIFTRFADTQIGHRQKILMPKVSHVLDYEGELAVIIGTAGRYIPQEKAWDHIAGMSCYNDSTLRDFQYHTHQFQPGKNFPNTGAFGPYLVTVDEVENFAECRIRTTLNGQVMQDAVLGDMIFSVPEIVAYISSFTPLKPGDVIVTGTPGGVGIKRDPQVLMKPGDEVIVEIDHVGRLENVIGTEC
jgi:2-keto-4-pentenoate hydratase/2-oxohepta-3-ene-1,7-dioic acid hydratase in catechol pathway